MKGSQADRHRHLNLHERGGVERAVPGGKGEQQGEEAEAQQDHPEEDG